MQPDCLNPNQSSGIGSTRLGGGGGWGCSPLWFYKCQYSDKPANFRARAPDFSAIYRVAQKKRNSRYSRFFRTCYNWQLSFFTLLDRASFPHYNKTKIIKFGWELFISWVISYGLSFSGFARFPEFRGTINDKSMANPKMRVHKKLRYS